MKQYLVPFAWCLGLVVTVTGYLSWYQDLPNGLSHLSAYQLFPVFGTVAFSLMWTHYILSVLRTYYDVPKEIFAGYNRVSYIVVLVALLLHPGLLIWQLWRDKLGLPIDYVAPDLRMYVILGQIAWIAFLLFELHRFYGERSWWHWIERASDVAMLAIVVHALNLGASLASGWFRAVWMFYAVTLIGAISYQTYNRHKTTGKWL